MWYLSFQAPFVLSSGFNALPFRVLFSRRADPLVAACPPPEAEVPTPKPALLAMTRPELDVLDRRGVVGAWSGQCRGVIERRGLGRGRHKLASSWLWSVDYKRYIC